MTLLSTTISVLICVAPLKTAHQPKQPTLRQAVSHTSVAVVILSAH